MIEKHEPPHRYAHLIACIKSQRRRLSGAVIYGAMIHSFFSVICALAHTGSGSLAAGIGGGEIEAVKPQ